MEAKIIKSVQKLYEHYQVPYEMRNVSAVIYNPPKHIYDLWVTFMCNIDKLSLRIDDEYWYFGIMEIEVEPRNGLKVLEQRLFNIEATKLIVERFNFRVDTLCYKHDGRIMLGDEIYIELGDYGIEFHSRHFTKTTVYDEIEEFENELDRFMLPYSQAIDIFNRCNSNYIDMDHEYHMDYYMLFDGGYAYFRDTAGGLRIIVNGVEMSLADGQLQLQ
jgi:hypothetical protein